MQALSGTSSKGKTINGVGSCLQPVLLPQATKSQLTFRKLGGSVLALVTAAAADGQKKSFLEGSISDPDYRFTLFILGGLWLKC